MINFCCSFGDNFFKADTKPEAAAPLFEGSFRPGIFILASLNIFSTCENLSENLERKSEAELSAVRWKILATFERPANSTFLYLVGMHLETRIRRSDSFPPSAVQR